MKPMKSMKQLGLLTVATLMAASLNASADEGSAIFTKECAKCHGADGKGDTAMGKKLKIKDLTVEAAKLGDAKIESTVKAGVKDGDKVRMKGFPDMSDADVKAVAKYVLTLKK
ncbi:MAG: c-type cytochrome [Verrucomicrobiota bacterium]